MDLQLCNHNQSNYTCESNTFLPEFIKKLFFTFYSMYIETKYTFFLLTIYNYKQASTVGKWKITFELESTLI